MRSTVLRLSVYLFALVLIQSSILVGEASAQVYIYYSKTIAGLGSIHRATLATSINPSFTQITGPDNPGLFAVDDTGSKPLIVYQKTTTNELRRINADGTNDEQILTGNPAMGGIAIDTDNDLFFMTLDKSISRGNYKNFDKLTDIYYTPGSIIDIIFNKHDGHLYFYDNGGSFVKMTSSGTLVTSFVHASGRNIKLAYDKDYLYFSDRSNGKISRVPFSPFTSAGVQELHTTDRPLGMHAHDSKIYAINDFSDPTDKDQIIRLDNDGNNDTVYHTETSGSWTLVHVEVSGNNNGSSGGDGDGDGDGSGDSGCDTDSDGDGTPNCSDGCPDDANKVTPGTCGCGLPERDPCDMDQCPNDDDKSVPGQCGCGTADTDSDNDGTADCNDECPNNSDKIEEGTCGCNDDGCVEPLPDFKVDGDGNPVTKLSLAPTVTFEQKNKRFRVTITGQEYSKVTREESSILAISAAKKKRNRRKKKRRRGKVSDPNALIYNFRVFIQYPQKVGAANKEKKKKRRRRRVRRIRSRKNSVSLDRIPGGSRVRSDYTVSPGSGGGSTNRSPQRITNISR